MLAARAPCLRLVRVNAAGSPWLEDDLAAVADLGLDAVVLPKATPEALTALDGLGLPVVAIVETADGLARAQEVAGSGAVAALQLGAVDLGLALGLEPRPDGLELLVRALDARPRLRGSPVYAAPSTRSGSTSATTRAST